MTAPYAASVPTVLTRTGARALRLIGYRHPSDKTSEYRIDDLARAAGTTTRNVRAYQERGLLQAPTRRNGRAMIYDDSHLQRLRIIDALLQRGFTTAHIGDFITSWETGQDLTEVLGLQDEVAGRWADTALLEIPQGLVASFLGDDDADLLERLVDAGLARTDGDLVSFPQPALVEIFAELHGYGFALTRLAEFYEYVSAKMTDVAAEMVEVAQCQITNHNGAGWLPETDDAIAETSQMLTHLRELGVAAVHAALAAALDTAFESGLGDYLATTGIRRTDTGAG